MMINAKKKAGEGKGIGGLEQRSNWVTTFNEDEFLPLMFQVFMHVYICLRKMISSRAMEHP